MPVTIGFHAAADVVPEPEADSEPSIASHPTGVECISIVEHFGFNIGSAVKHLWLAGLSSEPLIGDLAQALWFITRELKRVEATCVAPADEADVVSEITLEPESDDGDGDMDEAVSSIHLA